MNMTLCRTELIEMQSGQDLSTGQASLEAAAGQRALNEAPADRGSPLPPS